MKANLKLLEERVRAVVKRLHDVSRERDRLREELTPLQRKVETLEQAHSERHPRAIDPELDSELERIERGLSAAVRELRGR